MKYIDVPRARGVDIYKTFSINILKQKSILN